NAQTGTFTGMVDHFTKFAIIDKTKLAAGFTAPDVSEPLAAAVKYVLNKEELSDWEAYGLATAGVKVPDSYLLSAERTLKERGGQFRVVTDYERMAIAVQAAGGNPRNIAGYDLIERIV